jgi:hypothetical protein
MLADAEFLLAAESVENQRGSSEEVTGRREC